MHDFYDAWQRSFEWNVSVLKGLRCTGAAALLIYLAMTQLFDFAATCLHAGAQGKGKLTQWRFQNVDQSHRHKDLLGVQNILLISQNINSKHRQSNLQTDNSESLS